MIPKNIKPTESELTILNVLWNKNQATVREVHEVLNLKKDSGYTTTLKLMQIMHEKGLVTRNDSSKTHIYKANVSKEKTQNQLLGNMINNLFSGSAAQLVMQTLGNHNATTEELNEIQSILNQLKKK
jgi:BlaI family penicillinase repressor